MKVSQKLIKRIVIILHIVSNRKMFSDDILLKGFELVFFFFDKVMNRRIKAWLLARKKRLSEVKVEITGTFREIEV